jgi:hypothetical protein
MCRSLWEEVSDTRAWGTSVAQLPASRARRIAGSHKEVEQHGRALGRR